MKCADCDVDAAAKRVYLFNFIDGALSRWVCEPCLDLLRAKKEARRKEHEARLAREAEIADAEAVVIAANIVEANARAAKLALPNDVKAYLAFDDAVRARHASVRALIALRSNTPPPSE